MGELRFDDQVVIVTGAGRGIGRAQAMLLAERGASVVVSDLGSANAGGGWATEEVAAEIGAFGGTAVASMATVATPEGAQSIVELAIEQFGRIDAVVNNAGVLDHGPFPAMTADDVQRQLSVHVLGYFTLTRAAWTHMARHNYGRVVMTTSAAGLCGRAAQPASGSADGGVVGLVRSLACLGSDVGITVNAVAPVYSGSGHPPATTAPIVALLAHASCPVNGEIFTASSVRVARTVVAETRGFSQPDHQPEDLLRNWATVVDDDVALPASSRPET